MKRRYSMLAKKASHLGSLLSVPMAILVLSMTF